MLVIVIAEDGDRAVATNIHGLDYHRLSFGERQDWLEALGFVNRLSLRWIPYGGNQAVVLQRGGIVFGFKDDTGLSYGFLVEQDTELRIGTANINYYITMDKNGSVEIENGNWDLVRGIAYGITIGIPWYTFNDRALIGKIIRREDLIIGFAVCDDPYWCEWEPQEWLHF